MNFLRREVVTILVASLISPEISDLSSMAHNFRCAGEIMSQKSLPLSSALWRNEGSDTYSTIGKDDAAVET